MKTVLLTLTYLVGVGELLLAIYFWATNSKNEIRRVLSLLAFVTSVWVISSGLTSYTNPTPAGDFFTLLVFIGGVLIGTSLLHFILLYPVSLWRMDKWHGFLLYVPALIFAAIILTTKTVYIGYVGSVTDSGRMLPGPLYTIYNTYIIILYTLGLMVLAIKSKRSDGRNRKYINWTFWSIIGGSPAILIDLIIPSFFKGVYPNALYGAISTVVWLGTMTYIARKQ